MAVTPNRPPRVARDRRPLPRARRRGVSLRVRRARQPCRRRGRHADDLPERLPRARAGRRASRPTGFSRSLERDQAALSAGAVEAAPGRARRSHRHAETDDADGPSVGEPTALSKIPPAAPGDRPPRFEGRSYAEIAEILGDDLLETLLFRARSLAEELEHQLTCTRRSSPCPAPSTTGSAGRSADASAITSPSVRTARSSRAATAPSLCAGGLASCRFRSR